MSKQETDKSVRSRIEEIAGVAHVAPADSEPLLELIERVRVGLDEELEEFAEEIRGLQDKLDELEAEAEEQMETE